MMLAVPPAAAPAASIVLPFDLFRQTRTHRGSCQIAVRLLPDGLLLIAKSCFMIRQMQPTVMAMNQASSRRSISVGPALHLPLAGAMRRKRSRPAPVHRGALFVVGRQRIENLTLPAGGDGRA